MPAIIENPILNSPYRAPARYFRFDEHGITGDVVEARRPSAYFVPIPPPKTRGKQLSFETQWTQDRLEENQLVNQVRERVAVWRRGGYRDTTRTTYRLLEYWTNPDRERPLFFCQVEALETAIYLTEVAPRYDPWLLDRLHSTAETHNPGLYRLAFKMATGTGKTVVMAMLIAWQALNKQANAQDRRFGDAFLVVAPGITIRDRLRVLLPSDADNYYRARDVAPPADIEALGTAKIVIANFHTFLPRERGDASKLTKRILTRGRDDASPFRETPDQMVRRVCRELGTKRNVVVINDEAHHCYRRRLADDDGEKLTGDERREAARRDEEARVWIGGLEAVRAKLGVRAVYDLSATPFFLKGSGFEEGTLFPWVVSDFSLIDAIESGLVKVPRVPVDDDGAQHDMPTFRNIWARIKDELPKRGAKGYAPGAGPVLPATLDAALRSLYRNYERSYREWEASAEARAAGQTPPVFIVVCNNTTVSKRVYDFIAGWADAQPDGSVRAEPGALPIFSNVSPDGRWLDRPNTILVDSAQLESGEAMSDEFKAAAAREIEEFKAEYRLRFHGRDADKLTDEDLLREVMNTVGKAGKLGEHVKCVVSVSMLTEGWDAKTVTHVLGVRAFSTQLLCEQVVGRALRRTSFALNDAGMFEAEYAEVYGVPFSFIPTHGAATVRAPQPVTRVRALPDRAELEIRFPRIAGYRYQLPTERLAARFDDRSRLRLSTMDVTTRATLEPIVGVGTVASLDDLKRHREQEVVYGLARVLLDAYFRDAEGASRPWLFPQLVAIARRWMAECLELGDDAFPQLLLLRALGLDAAAKIYQAIVSSAPGEPRLVALPESKDPVGSTRVVDFDTVKATRATREDRCHVSHVVLDSLWEGKAAAVIEAMPEVVAYVKNQGLGFSIPYTIGGREHGYVPDFIVRLDDGHGPGDLLNVVVEVSGEDLKEKAAKTAHARNLWVPAVNNHGGFGRWAFVEVTDPGNTRSAIRAAVGAKAAMASAAEG